MEALIQKFDIDGSGRVDWANGEFLNIIASIGVTSISNIDDFIFSAAFRTFDHVRKVVRMLMMMHRMLMA